MKSKSSFYERMLEAKKRKKQQLEQEQLAAEFNVHPERFKEQLPPVIIKTESEQKLDAAFSQLQAKLKASQPLTQKELIEQAFNEIERKAQGL